MDIMCICKAENMLHSSDNLNLTHTIVHFKVKLKQNAKNQ